MLKQGVSPYSKYDYSYLKSHYYSTLFHECEGDHSVLTENLADGFSVPIAVAKAAMASLPALQISVDIYKVQSPCLLYPLHPFSCEYVCAQTDEEVKEGIKILSRSERFTVCIQQLQPGDQVETFTVLEGECLNPHFNAYAERLGDLFGIPTFRAMVIRRRKTLFFSALRPVNSDGSRKFLARPQHSISILPAG